MTITLAEEKLADEELRRRPVAASIASYTTLSHK